MKKQVLTFLFLLTSLVIFAKNEVPNYGEIDKTDLQLKECEFDKDAAAYELMSYANVYYKVIDGNFNIFTERRIRIKIFKKEGLDEANIKIRFLSKDDYESIRDISGITYNLDSSGNIVKSALDPNSVKIKKIDNLSSEATFTLPNVKEGSVFEYKFTKRKKSISNIDDWYFQGDIPTRVSEYNVSIPSMFIFDAQLMTDRNVEQENDLVGKNASFRGSHLAYTTSDKSFILKDIPAFKKEPYMGAEKDYLQKMSFKLKRIQYGDGQKELLNITWDNLTKALLVNEDFGGQLTKRIPHTKNLNETINNISDNYKKMTTIYDYVRKTMKWNGEEGIYASMGVKNAWDKKTGNTADINFILIDLLRNEGIKAFPLIASTKDNGTVIKGNTDLEQFNVMMACVMIDDKRYILNAADKYNPAYLVPSYVLNNDAYIVDLTNGGWILLSDKIESFTNKVSIFATIKPHDSITGNAIINSYDYARNKFVKIWETDSSSLKDYYAHTDSTLKIDSMKIADEQIDSLPLQQMFDFGMPIKYSGYKEYFTLNLFQGFTKNPFLADQRETDINFDYKQSYIIEGKISIPDNYQFELPENIKISMPDSSIVMSRESSIDISALKFRITLNFKKTYYPAKNYLLLKEFYKKLFSALNEKINIEMKRNS
ncbi:MAG TPA: hypothetical protein VMU83_04880 [Hanamia sp.]|nr:hypothetical protein [Hanamia sp.]